MAHKYGDLTGMVMEMCHRDQDNLIVMKQIAWNLAYIADELAEANRINSQTIGDICRTIDMSGIGLPPENPDE